MLRNRIEKVASYAPAPPNNGMHPTPHHAASHAACVGARVMPGVTRSMEYFALGR